VAKDMSAQHIGWFLDSLVEVDKLREGVWAYSKTFDALMKKLKIRKGTLKYSNAKNAFRGVVIEETMIAIRDALGESF